MILFIKKCLFVGSLLFLLYACDDRSKDIELFVQNEYEQQFVLKSLLNPDSVVSIAVHHTVSASTPWSEIPFPFFVDSATVTLYEDSILVEILPHTHNGIYTSANGYRPKAQHSYYFVVSAPGYDTAYNLPEIIPDTASIESVVFIDSIGIYQPQNYNYFLEYYGQTISRLQFSFRDPAGSYNYYALNPVLVEGSIFVPTDNPFAALTDNIGGCPLQGQPVCINDECFAGVAPWVNIDIIPYYGNYTIQNMSGIKLGLATVSESYYKRAVSYENYVKLDDNVFQEPYNVYSNIQNGYGLVAAYCANNRLIVF